MTKLRRKLMQIKTRNLAAAQAYLNEIVHPTVRDFEENPTSRRHAFLACVTTFHTVDYIDKHLRQEFGRQSQAFKIIDRVAHAFKHTETGGLPGTRLKNYEVVKRPPAMFGYMQLGLSMCGDTVGGVTLWTDRAVDLLAQVKEAAAFLENQIQQSGNSAVDTVDDQNARPET